MANIPSGCLPLNELNEIVFEQGVGSNNVTGFISPSEIPSNPLTNKIPASFPGSAVTTNVLGEAISQGYQGKQYNGMVLSVSASGDTTGVADTAAINGALATVSMFSAGKGAVQLNGKSGIYYLKASINSSNSYAAINLVSNVDISSINSPKVKLATSTHPSGYGGIIFFGNSVSNINIVGIEIDGNRSSFTSPAFGGPAYDGIVGSGIYLRSCTDINVNHCWSHSNIYHGFLCVQNSTRVHCDFNKLSDNGYRAAHYNSDDTGTLTNCSMNFNDVFQNGAASDNTANGGMFPALGTTYRIECIGNNISNEPFIGISATGTNGGVNIAREIFIHSNIITNCTVGIQTANGLTDSQIRNNNISNCITAGFIAGQSANTKYDGNTIRRTVGGTLAVGGYGYTVGATTSDALTNCSFSGNHVIQCAGNTSTRCAVYVVGGAHKGISIVQNFIVNCGVDESNTCGGIAFQAPSGGKRYSGVAISQNFISGNRGHGIVVYDADNPLISLNQIYDNYESSGPRGAAIYIRGTTDDARVFMNVALNDNVTNNQVQFATDSTVTNIRFNNNHFESTNASPIAPTSGATGTYSANTSNGKQNYPSGFVPIHGLVTSTVDSGHTVALTTATAANVTSISLPAGTWDVWGQVDYVLTSTTATLHQTGISLTSVTLPTQAGGVVGSATLGTDGLKTFPLPTTTLTGTLSQDCGVVQVVVTGNNNVTVYLVASATFSAGTEAAYGTIRARLVD